MFVVKAVLPFEVEIVDMMLVPLGVLLVAVVDGIVLLVTMVVDGVFLWMVEAVILVNVVDFVVLK